MIITASSREVDAFRFDERWTLEAAHLWLCEYSQKTLRVERQGRELVFLMREHPGGVEAQPVTGKSDTGGITAYAKAGALGLVSSKG